MENKIQELKELLKIKESQNTTELDKEKITNIKFLLEQEKIFFKLEPQTAIGILDYLGIKKENIKEYYLSLISMENFTTKSR